MLGSIPALINKLTSAEEDPPGTTVSMCESAEDKAHGHCRTSKQIESSNVCPLHANRI